MSAKISQGDQLIEKGKLVKKLDAAIALYFVTKKLHDGGFPTTELKSAIVGNLGNVAEKLNAGVQVVPGMVWITFLDEGVQREYTESNYRKNGKVISKKVDGEWKKTGKNLIDRVFGKAKR